MARPPWKKVLHEKEGQAERHLEAIGSQLQAFPCHTPKKNSLLVRQDLSYRCLSVPSTPLPFLAPPTRQAAATSSRWLPLPVTSARPTVSGTRKAPSARPLAKPSATTRRAAASKAQSTGSEAQLGAGQRCSAVKFPWPAMGSEQRQNWPWGCQHLCAPKTALHDTSKTKPIPQVKELYPQSSPYSMQMRVGEKLGSPQNGLPWEMEAMNTCGAFLSQAFH